MSGFFKKLFNRIVGKKEEAPPLVEEVKVLSAPEPEPVVAVETKPEPKAKEPEPKAKTRPEPKKVEVKKPQAKKPQPKKPEAKRLEPKKQEPKWVEVKKPEPKKPELKKPEPKKVAAKKTEPAKPEPAAKVQPEPPPKIEVPVVEAIAVSPPPTSEPVAALEPVATVEPVRVPRPGPATEPAAERKGWFSRLREGLSKSSKTITSSITSIFTKRKLDKATLEELEDVLIQADLGLPMAERIIKAVSAGRFDKEIEPEEVKRILAEEVAKVLKPVEVPFNFGSEKPFVILVVGVNGSGKTTLLNVLIGAIQPDRGEVRRGQTVRLAHLSQAAMELPGELRVLESLEQVRLRITLGDGTELTAGKLCERFGFGGARGRTLVRDLSGGERRRLQLMRLLMDEPNVLVLDEPTNDLDIDTLTALEDLLDGWPGTLIVVSHDRYFVERVCDNVYALMGDGDIRHLPGGIDQYLELRQREHEAPLAPTRRTSSAPSPGTTLRAARKEAQRVERELDRLAARHDDLQRLMAESATDYVRLGSLTTELRSVADEREQLETTWLELATQLDGQ